MPEERCVYKAKENANGQVKMFQARLVKVTEKMVVIERPEFDIRTVFNYRTHIPKDEVYFSPLEAAQARLDYLAESEQFAQQKYQLATRQRKSAEALVKRYTDEARITEPGGT